MQRHTRCRPQCCPNVVEPLAGAICTWSFALGDAGPVRCRPEGHRSWLGNHPQGVAVGELDDPQNRSARPPVAVIGRCSATADGVTADIG